MKIDKKDLEEAVVKNLLTKTQADKLWSFWLSQQKNIPTFRLTHILYYLGGLIAISAVTLYVTNAWEKLVGGPLLLLALLFFALGFGLMHYFIKIGYRIPAGIMAAFSLTLVPLIIYNIQYLLNYHPPQQFDYTDFHYWISAYWVNMELATLLIGVIMLYFYRLPFLLFPIAVILWYMSMDFWPLLFHKEIYSFQDRAIFTMIFGLIMLALSVYVDYRSSESKMDYAFWLYIFAVMTFWGGLSAQNSNYELSKFIYCLINVVMLFASALLDRRVFAVFGTIGILGYLGHLSLTVFANSLSFPIAMVLIGILIIFIAILFTKMESKLKLIMGPYIPAFIKRKM